MVSEKPYAARAGMATSLLLYHYPASKTLALAFQQQRKPTCLKPNASANIAVATEVGVGTTVTITIPLPKPTG